MSTLTKGLKLIGKGAFTKCYRLSDEKVLLVSNDPIKECMALGWFPDSPLFPKVEFGAERGTYEMNYYPRLRGTKKFLDHDQYEIYKTLRALHERTVYRCNGNYHKLYEAFEQNLTGDLKETMLEALDACADMGFDVSFEISPRNIAIKDGKLILLDCFFIRSELAKTLSI